jgi:uncharacterized protein (TIGR00369 family)
VVWATRRCSESYRLVWAVTVVRPRCSGTATARVVATLGPGQFGPTLDLHVQFLRPAHPGRLTGRGRVVRRGKDIAFLAGELVDEGGQIVAVATATAQIRAVGP